MQETEYMRVTHLTLPDEIRHLAAIRAAEQKRTLSQYVASLVRDDADLAGLRQYLARTTSRQATPTEGHDR